MDKLTITGSSRPSAVFIECKWSNLCLQTHGSPQISCTLLLPLWWEATDPGEVEIDGEDGSLLQLLQCQPATLTSQHLPSPTADTHIHRSLSFSPVCSFIIFCSKSLHERGPLLLTTWCSRFCEHPMFLLSFPRGKRWHCSPLTSRGLWTSYVVELRECAAHVMTHKLQRTVGRVTSLMLSHCCKGLFWEVHLSYYSNRGAAAWFLLSRWEKKPLCQGLETSLLFLMVF